ncbi:uncharacterized protein LOC128325152 isoform X2 [Hemicordylus capensis]|uniref:uncharacterized protein LOC128325152 isoform X2 n=1 Tax=Hemicordylus capensis TaxID=884348 RepID=UPI002303EA05|nr:uncharacterized protein LOC128325152 isoform X2 [Hemicordylus capensis]
MGPKKAKAKTGGKRVRPPPRPAPISDSSSDEDGDMGTVRVLIARLEALERQKLAPASEEKGGPSGSHVASKRVTRGLKRAKLMQSLASRIEALEAGNPQLVPAAVDLTSDNSGSPIVSGSGGGDARPADAQGLGAALSPARARGGTSSRTDAVVAVEPWRLEAQRAVWASLAPSTRTAYNRQCRAFMDFRTQVGLGQDWPPPAEHLMQFLVHLKGKGLSSRALAGYLAALAFQSKARGLADTTGDFRVRRMLEGWSREHPAEADSRKPILPLAIRGAVEHLAGVCRSPYETALFHAAMVVLFFGAFRASELFPRGRFSHSTRVVQFGDTVPGRAALTLRLRFSKTDQRGRGHLVSLHRAEDVLLCPVRALNAYLTLRGAAPGCLFIHEDGRPLTQYQFWAVARRALHVAGVDTARLSLHSFRIGAASTASRLGLSGETIQRIGRWRSATYRKYVR